MARKRKKKTKGGRRRARQGARDPSASKAAPPDGSKPDAKAGAGGEPRERMPVSALAVTLPDVSEAENEASGEVWSPDRRQYEPEVPAFEVHPDNPDAAPVVSGVIQGFIAPENPEARASSVLAVEFGATEQPSIQIEATYRRDSEKLLYAKIPADGDQPDAEAPDHGIPVEAVAPRSSATPGLSPGPFDGDTEKVTVHPDFEVKHAAQLEHAARQQSAAEELPAAEVGNLSDDESLPIYAVDQAETPLIKVPGEGEEGPAPTKRSSVLDEPLQPETRADDPGAALVHPSPFPPAHDPRIKDSGTLISDARAYTAPSGEPAVPVAVGPFQPAAFVSTAEGDPATDGPAAVKPKLAKVPPLTLPSSKNRKAPAAVLPEEPVPPDEPASTAAGVVSGTIGGAMVASTGLQRQQDAGEPLTTSGSIIIDPELIAAEKAAAERAAAEKAAAEKAAAEKAAAEKAAAEKAAAEKAAAEKAAAEKAAAERAAAEKAAVEKATAEKAAAEKATAEKAAAEKAAAKKAAVHYELSESIAPPERKAPEPPSTRPAATAPLKTPVTSSKGEAFSDLEIAFFEQDLHKVEEVDTFDDLVADLPEQETPWGLLFGKPKGKPKGKPIKRAEPNRQAAADDKPKKPPRPPHKRK